jgi:hypothetical protein
VLDLLAEITADCPKQQAGNIRIAMLTAKLKLLDGPPHTL